MTKRLVLDASAAINVAVKSDRAPWFLEKLHASPAVSAPDFFCPEVANGLWKYVQGKILDREQAIDRYEAAVSLVDHFFPARELTAEALGEGIEHRHAIYDLIYGVLARRTGSAVLTADRRFARLLENMKISVLLAP